MNAQKIHSVLAQQGVRLFALSLKTDRMTYIHGNKTVKEWREDIRKFISEINHLRNRSGWAGDEVINELTTKLDEAGYIEVCDVVSDVYEGRIASYSAGIEDDPAHEEQADGFGHYGWESKAQI